MKCELCEIGNIVKSTTDKLIDRKPLVIRVSNIPIKRCDLCGDTIEYGEVIKQIENIIKSIGVPSQASVIEIDYRDYCYKGILSIGDTKLPISLLQSDIDMVLSNFDVDGINISVSQDSTLNFDDLIITRSNLVEEIEKILN